MKYILALFSVLFITFIPYVCAYENVELSTYTYESPLVYSIESKRNSISSISIDLHYDNSHSLCGEIPDDVEEISIELANEIRCGDDVPMIFQGDDVLSEAMICPDASEFTCLNGLGIIFSIPRVLNERMEWEYHGIKFNRSEELINILILGKSIDIYYITAKGINADFYGSEQHFWYSPEFGLMGFNIRYINKVSSVDTDTIYILKGRCGFGASRKCYRM